MDGREGVTFGTHSCDWLVEDAFIIDTDRSHKGKRKETSLGLYCTVLHCTEKYQHLTFGPCMHSLG